MIGTPAGGQTWGGKEEVCGRKRHCMEVKDLNAEYSALLTKKKALYPEYRKARDEMQDIVKAQKNVELFFAEEKDSKEKEQIR